MFCSIVNLVTAPGPLNTKDNPTTYFFYTIGGAEVLSLLGSRMLIHLKEAANVEDEAEGSFRISSDISVAEFRTYSRIEVLYWTRQSSRRERGRGHVVQAA